MKYTLTNCKLTEDISTAIGHKRFDALVSKATAMSMSWSYSFSKKTLVIFNAPAGLAKELSAYGAVKEEPDNA